MSDLLIQKKNESYLLLSGEPSVLQELRDVFTFYADGYRFHPKYRTKLWDGKIRLLSQISQTKGLLYYGLLFQVIHFCKSREYTYELAGDLKNQITEEDKKSIYNFIEENKKDFQNTRIELRDYQINGVISALLNKRQLILSPTSSGKSLTIYLINKFLIENNLKGLIITPNVSLIMQLYSNYEEYAEYSKWDVTDQIHTIYSGKEKISDKHIQISTWQSLHQIKEPSYFEKFDYVIVDEVHTAKAASLTSILEKCVNAQYRIGLTGTLDGLKINEKTLIGLFGQINRLITTKELMDRKQVSNFNIKCLVLKYDKETCKSLKNYKYQDEIKYLVSNPKRNAFIKNLALAQTKNTIILFNFVETHGKVIYELLQSSIHKKDRNIYFIHGGVAGEEREKIRKIVETEENSIIVASVGTMSTGVSINNLHNIIFAISGKSRIRNLQSIGRVLRLHDEKEIATLYDICDNLSYGKHKNHTIKHFIERVKTYDSEQFDYKIININFEN